ncbi:hypothetical protein F7725_007926 [Dissostichus mawsoni]|uniref:Uncharacterized protein n=1 Tax=Dissostichus mawsoni TaxID=36200 RepID=A0A7J5Y6M1_DISMA|nr:hypothetical protein F7725_007926 [Dissostichus mawsoni]
MSVIATEIQSDHHEAKSQPAEEKRRRRRKEEEEEEEEEGRRRRRPIRIVHPYDDEDMLKLGSVLCEALEADLVPQQLEELFQGGASHLVVVHLLLGALARSALLSDFGCVEGQSEARQIELREKVLQHLLDGQPPGGPVLRGGRHCILKDRTSKSGQLNGGR